MSTTVDRPTAARPTAADLLPLLGAAARAVLHLLVPLAVVTVVAWLSAVRSTSSLASVVRVGADLWLLGHGAPVAVVGGAVGVAPLGLTLLAALACRRAVRVWVRDQAESERPVPHLPAVGVFTAAYGVLVGAVALLSRSSVAAAPALTALAGGCLVGAAGALWALHPHRAPLPPWVPAPLVRALRPAGGALAGLLGAGALLLAVALVAGRERVLLLHTSLDPGLVGGALLTLAQALLLPTLAVWAAAWLAGPGFAVGVGTSVAPGGTSLATLPAVPVLGALPVQGAMPAVAWLAVAVPVLAGAGALLLHERRAAAGPERGLGPRCATAGLVGLLAGLGAGLLSAAAAGGAGAGRMAQLGPTPWLVGLAVAGEVAAGALLAVLLHRAWRARRPQPLPVGLPDGPARAGLIGGARPAAGATAARAAAAPEGSPEETVPGRLRRAGGATAATARRAARALRLPGRRSS
ncbi:cell division protein PerM [Kineococcus terrestris]|uniref:cell division protein PerM n=1 Tax=Kineococcus terrestris TaxID=2044856 RepID=UPI0034DB11B0